MAVLLYVELFLLGYKKIINHIYSTQHNPSYSYSTWLKKIKSNFFHKYIYLSYTDFYNLEYVTNYNI